MLRRLLYSRVQIAIASPAVLERTNGSSCRKSCITSPGFGFLTQPLETLIAACMAVKSCRSNPQVEFRTPEPRAWTHSPNGYRGSQGVWIGIRSHSTLPTYFSARSGVASHCLCSARSEACLIEQHARCFPWSRS